MRSYYEKTRDDSGEIMLQYNAEGSFPPHFHRNLEIVLAKRGSYEILINGSVCKAEGDAVIVIDSFDLHEYTKRIPDENGMLESIVVVVPYHYVRGFREIRRGRAIAEPVICDGELTDRLMALTKEYIASQTSEAIRQNAAELMLSILAERIRWVDQRTKGEVELVREILTYIHENYRSDIKRSDIARTLGYAPAHISRVFHSYLSVGIPEYVAKLRLDHVDHARQNGDSRSLSALICDAGFNSQQTYYRCKKKYMGAKNEGNIV